MSTSKVYDIIIIGGGIIGLTLLKHIKSKYKSINIKLLEKEKSTCQFASGLNSGVLHAGFYYHADTLKAKFCKDGNYMLTQFCDEHKIKLNRCGKLVVAKNENELNSLNELIKRADKNRVEAYKITEKEARQIEPNVITHKYALWSPTTKSANPKDVGEALTKLNLPNIIFNTKFSSAEFDSALKVWKIITNKEQLNANHIINVGGMHADVIAKQFGFAKDYNILPFRGTYKASNYNLRTHVYPVPDLLFPFLGVHTTLSVDGDTKLGPSITPGFSREPNSFSISDSLNITLNLTKWAIKSPHSLKLLNLASKTWFDFNLNREVSKLVSDSARSSSPKKSYKIEPGTRSQLIDANLELVQDFIIEGDKYSTHVLNVISPGWTCSMPFAEHIFSIVEKKINLQ